MLFNVRGYLKPGPRAKPRAAEFLLQQDPSLEIRLAGTLLNANGEVTGISGLLEAESSEVIERYFKENPDLGSDLFDLEISEFNLEIGHLH
jgi:hypothetical protein